MLTKKELKERGLTGTFSYISPVTGTRVTKRYDDEDVGVLTAKEAVALGSAKFAEGVSKSFSERDLEETLNKMTIDN